jgi:hypothetical protein
MASLTFTIISTLVQWTWWGVVTAISTGTLAVLWFYIAVIGWDKLVELYQMVSSGPTPPPEQAYPVSAFVDEYAYLKKYSVPMFRSVQRAQKAKRRQTRCIVCDHVRVGYACPTCTNSWVCGQCNAEITYTTPEDVKWPCCRTVRHIGNDWECTVRRYALTNHNQRVRRPYWDALPDIREFSALVTQRRINPPFY